MSVLLTEPEAFGLTQNFAQLTPENQGIAKIKLKAYGADRHANGKPLFPTWDAQVTQRRDDLENWWIDNKEPAHIASGYADMPELKPDARRLSLLGQLTGTDPKVIAPNPGAWRVSVAQAWGNPDAATDDAAFDAEATKQLKKQRDFRYLTQGNGREDEASKPLNEGALMNHAALSAKDGKSAADGFAAWQAAAKVRPEFAAADGRDLFEIYSGIHAKAAENFQGLKVKADAIFGILQREMNNRQPLADTSEAETLIEGLSPAERSMIGELVGKQAEKLKAGEGKSTAQKSGETMGRVFGRLLEAQGSSEIRGMLSQFDSLKGFQPGDEVSADVAGDPKAIVDSEMRQLQGRSNTLSAGALFAVPRGDFVQLTAEQAAAANAEVAKRRRALNAKKYLLDLAEGTVDPVKADSIAGRFGLGALNVGTSMVSFAMPGGSVMNTIAYVEDEAARLESLGVDKGTAAAQSLVVGGAQAALDRLQLSIFKRLPQTGITLNSFLTPSASLVGSVGKRFVTAGLPTAVFESGIEVAQDTTPLLVQKFATAQSSRENVGIVLGIPPVVARMLSALGADQPSVSWDQIGKEAWATSEEMFFSMLPLAMLGAGVGGHSDYRAARQMVSDSQALEALGFSAEQIGTITAPESTADRVRMLQGLWKERTPVVSVARDAGEQAVNDALNSPGPVSQVAAAAGARADLNVADAMAQKRADFQAEMAGLDERGVSLTRQQSAEGKAEWVVKDREAGTETSHPSFVSAYTQAKGRIAGLDLDQAEAMMQLADAFINQNRAGVQESFQYTGEVKDAFDRLNNGVDPEVMAERIRIEERRMGVPEGSLMSAKILGENTVQFKEVVADGVKRIVAQSVSKVNKGGTVFDALEEFVEGRQKAAGFGSAENRARDLSFIRLAERATGESFLSSKDDAVVTPADITEAISHIVKAEVWNRRANGGKFAAIGGAISRGLEAFGEKTKESMGLRTWLDAIKVLFRAIFRTADLLLKANKEGKLGEDFHGYVDNLLGLSEQKAHNQAVVDGLDLSPGPLGSMSLGGAAIASDAEYLKAVESGDMAEAQRMVDQAAKSAGYNVGPVWHGGGKSFDVFRSSIWGIHFGTKEQASKFRDLPEWMGGTGNQVLRSFYLKVSNLKRTQDVFGHAGDAGSGTAVVAAAKSEGHDGIIYKNVAEGSKSDDSYLVFDPNQIKSADPVTRDAEGKVIPLSQRFDSSKDSISFSLGLSLGISTGEFDTATQTSWSVGADVIAHNERLRTAPKSLLERMKNEYLQPAESNILFRPDRYYRVVDDAGYKDFLDVGYFRPNPDPSAQGYDYLYAAQGATAARYKGRYVLEVDPARSGKWEKIPDNSGYVRAEIGSVGKSDAIRVYERQADGSFAVLTDQIGDEALIEAAKGSRAQALDKAAPVQEFANATLVGPSSFSIAAHHGTPHKVDKFTTAKIGTGEGAQAFGWGLYFAEEKKTAAYYAEKLAMLKGTLSIDGVPYNGMRHELQSDVDMLIADAWHSIANDVKRKDVLIRELKSRAKGAFKNWKERFKMAIAKAQSTAVEVSGVKGNLYSVEISPPVEDFLDWDKPLSEQSEKVRSVILEENRRIGGGLSDGSTGEKVYYELVYQAGVDGVEAGPNVSRNNAKAKAASERLDALGVPGIKFLDANSRVESAGTYNFVVFRDDHVRIVEENGKPVSSFSIASADYLSAVAAMLDRAAVDPVQRLAANQRAAAQIAGMARAVRFNDANAVRNLSRAGLENERARMQARRTEELYQVIDNETPHLQEAVFVSAMQNNPLISLISTPVAGGKRFKSRLISAKQLRKQGRIVGGEYDGAADLPGFLFGGKESVDTLAQEAFEAGLIKDASADAFWRGIEQALTASSKGQEMISRYKEQRREARDVARAEANAWAEKQAKAQAGIDFERRELGRAMAALDTMLLSFPPEVRQMVGGFTKLADLKGNKARLEFFRDRVAKLEAAMEVHLQREYRKELGYLIEKARPKGAKEKGAKIVGKIGAEAHAWFAQIEPMLSMSSEQVAERLNAIELALAEDLTPQRQDELTNEWSLLHVFGDFRNKSALEMSSAFSDAQTIYETGRTGWVAVMEQRRTEREGLRGQRIVEVGGKATRKKQDAGAAKRRTKAGAVSAAIGGFARNLLSFRQVLADIFGRGSAAESRYDRMTREATRTERAARLRRERDFELALNSIYGTRNRLQRQRLLYDLVQPVENSGVIFRDTTTKDLAIDIDVAERIVNGDMTQAEHGLRPYEVTELRWLLDDHYERVAKDAAGARRSVLHLPRVARGKEHNKRLSRAQAMKVWLTYQMDEYKPSLARDGVDEITMGQIEAFLSPADLQLVGWMADQYENGYEELNAPFRRLYGVNLPRVKHYAPGTFQTSGNQAVNLPGEQANGGAGSMSSGFLRKRKKHVAELDLSNNSGAIGDYWQHVTVTEHWIAWAEAVDEMKSVFFNKDVNEAVKAEAGESAALTLRTWVDTHENDGVRQSYQNLEMRKWLSAMMGARAKVALGWKVGVWLKQATAAFGALLDLSARDFATSAARVLQGTAVLRYQDAATLPVMAQRLAAGGSPEIRMVLSGGAGTYFRPGVGNDFMQTGMDAINAIDGRFTMFSAAVAYDAHFRSAIRAGLSPEEARAAAADRTDLTLAKTAQPVETLDKSLFEISMPVAVKPFFMFMSEARKSVALEIAAVTQAMRGQGSWLEAGKILAVNHFLFGSMTWALGAMWRDLMNDDEETGDDPAWELKDWLLAISTGPLSGIPVLGDVLQTALARMTNSFLPSHEANLLEGNLSDLTKGVAAIMADPPEGEELEHYVKKSGATVRAMAQMIGGEFAAFGVAANVVEQVFNLGDDFIETRGEKETKLLKKADALEKEKDQAKLDALTSEQVAAAEVEKERKKAERRAKRLREIGQ